MRTPPNGKAITSNALFKLTRRLAAALALLPLALPARAKPTSAELLDMARQAESQGYHSLASHYYSHALKAGAPREAKRSLAKALQNAGKPGLAELKWREILEGSPSDSEALAALQKLKSDESEGGEEDVAVTDLPPPQKAEMPWTRGHGAWVYGEGRPWVKVLNDYNLAAPRSQRVKYLFPNAGTVGFNAGNASVRWELDNALILADGVLGESRVFPMLGGQAAGVASIKQREWDRIAKEIADKINSDERIAGLLFDIEPHDPKLHILFAYVKKYTQKPVGAALGVWEKNTFKYVDFLALMAYDHHVQLDNYLAAVRDQVRGFLRDARNAETKVLIGAPAIATHHEYESWSGQKDGVRVASHLYKMKDYVEALRRAISQALVDDDPAYLGMSIWALHPDGGVHTADDTRYFHPSVISPEVWKLFELPLSAERQ